jgi:hypothetical protein
MSARDDYPQSAAYAERLPATRARETHDMLNELDRLRRWRAEAECVIEEWDTVWEEAGCPGRLGGTRAAGMRALVLTLQDHRARLREELAKHGWGDFHYGDQGQDPAVVKLLEETE